MESSAAKEELTEIHRGNICHAKAIFCVFCIEAQTVQTAKSTTILDSSFVFTLHVFLPRIFIDKKYSPRIYFAQKKVY